MMTDGFGMLGFYSAGLVAFCQQSSCNLSANHSDWSKRDWELDSFPCRDQWQLTTGKCYVFQVWGIWALCWDQLFSTIKVKSSRKTFKANQPQLFVMLQGKQSPGSPHAPREVKIRDKGSAALGTSLISSYAEREDPVFLCPVLQRSLKRLQWFLCRELVNSQVICADWKLRPKNTQRAMRNFGTRLLKTSV